MRLIAGIIYEWTGLSAIDGRHHQLQFAFKAGDVKKLLAVRRAIRACIKMALRQFFLSRSTQRHLKNIHIAAIAAQGVKKKSPAAAAGATKIAGWLSLDQS